MTLPSETLLFSGHEYSVKNLEFAMMVEPENELIKQKLDLCKSLRAKDEFTVGNQLGDERHYHPFVRCFGGDRETRDYYSKITGETDPELIFAKVRALKD